MKRRKSIPLDVLDRALCKLEHEHDSMFESFDRLAKNPDADIYGWKKYRDQHHQRAMQVMFIRIALDKYAETGQLKITA